MLSPCSLLLFLMALRHSSILFLFASFLLSAKFIAVEAQLFIRGPFRLIDGPFSHFADPSDGPDDRGLQRYIIHVRRPEGPLFTIAKEWRNFYVSLLTKANAQFSLQGDDSPVSRILHAYRNVMTGFAAMFTTLEVEAMSKLDWFVHAYPDRTYDLLTTHTPEFMGLRDPTSGGGGRGGVWKESNMGEGVIIGVLDSGVTPGHPSFDDKGMPPPPSKWKGQCDFKTSACNNKLIGAQSFIRSYGLPAGSAVPPVDNEGHGTHTASTAAGAPVDHADALGHAAGVATGMAPRAHVAVYQVCDRGRCAGADILSAMDAAIEDGVDVISLSVGSAPAPFHADPVAIGAFGAIEKGIFVSCSAGNSGPGESTLSNEAPWILTVAATSTNRTIRATVKLGDGQEFDGESLYQQPPDFGSKNLPLVWAGDGSKMNASKCRNGSLDGLDVRGKVVLCERGGNSRIDKGKVVQGAGGAGMILMNEQVDGYSTLADAHVLPASHVAYAYGSKIKDYIKSSSNPTAAIVFKGTTMNTSRAPAIPSFSSRGPSKESPGILKPDIAAPGVSILAAWPSTLGQGSQPQQTSHTGAVFNMMSGTSMSCPHVSGVAALLKKAHPGWSPAAMKSAMMTTAYASDNTGQPIVDERLLPAGLFSFGAGQVDPAKALDPGLVYDIDPDDYVPYLCGLGYTDAHVRSVIHSQVSCSLAKRITEVELNYPSILVPLGGNHPTAVVFSRTVTNVGEAHETYSSEIDAPEGVSVRVDPTSLSFTSVNEKKTFKITFESKGGGGSGNAEGQLKWVSGKHVVRSPIAISFK